MMTACRHINILLNYPGCKQITDDDVYPLILNNTKDKTLLIVGMEERLIQDYKIELMQSFHDFLVMTYTNRIILSNKLRIRFVNIWNPQAIYGFQPDYVYII